MNVLKEMSKCITSRKMKNLLILENFSPQNIPAIQYLMNNITVVRLFCTSVNKLHNESFEAEKFRSFVLFTCPRNFLSRWFCSNMDLRESSYEGFCKSFLQRSACITCHETFTVYSMCTLILLSLIATHYHS